MQLSLLPRLDVILQPDPTSNTTRFPPISHTLHFGTTNTFLDADLRREMHPSASGHDIRQTAGRPRHSRHPLQLSDDYSAVHLGGHASQRSHAIQIDARPTNAHAYFKALVEQAELAGVQHLGP